MGGKHDSRVRIGVRRENVMPILAGVIEEF